MIVLSGGDLKSADRLALSPDGAFLAAAGGTQKRLAVWAVSEPHGPRHLFHHGFDRRLWHFCFNPADGVLLVGDNDGVVARDPADGTELWDIPARNAYECVTDGLDVSRDGRQLVVAISDGARADVGFQRWELNGLTQPVRKRGAKCPDGDLCRAVAFLPGTTSVVVAEDHFLRTDVVNRIRFVVRYRARLRVITATGRTTHELPTEFDSVRQLGVSSDGRFIAAQFPRAILVWHAATLERPPVEIASRKGFLFTGIAFHPSGRYLAATSNDATVKLYDTATWEVARTFTWDIGRMRSIAFSPDGTLAAAGSDTGKVVVWDVDL